MGAYKKTQVIIVSDNLKLKDYTLNNLSNIIGIETKHSVGNIVSAAAILNRFVNNIILIDIENQPVTLRYLKLLQEKYHLTIVIIKGKKPVEFNIIREYKNIIDKPDLYNIVQSSKYINYIEQIIRSSNDLIPGSLFKVMNTAVNESQRIITIASSTGGTKALEFIFSQLPKDMIPILVVQHMPVGFTRLFADSLDKISAISVVEAKQGDYLNMNTAYIAPGGKQMTLIKRNQKLSLDCFEGEKVHGVIPSADILFNTVASIMKNNVLGVILTGMGADGARGLLEMRNKGAKTIGQDEKTCIVYGMPKVAYDINAVEKQLPLEQIPQALIDYSNLDTL